jgi:putative FmdB family regulatory protein
MPIYEYECSKCGKINEALQKFSDKPLTKCRHCSGKLHKLISQSSFHLKGTGWYVTDYANKSRQTSAPPKNAESVPDSTVKKSKKKTTKEKTTADKTSS